MIMIQDLLQSVPVIANNIETIIIVSVIVTSFIACIIFVPKDRKFEK
ncbi:MAG: hypothetical protein ACKUBY_05910 [Candidatus Moraniibacteriota bacterium]|jgi:hypothetical protein